MEDGSPVNAMKIELVFEPRTKAIHGAVRPRKGTADVFDPQKGIFTEASTWQPGDGLIVGKHVVRALACDASGQVTELSISPSEIAVSSNADKFDFKVRK